jgi:hypothetical protein
MTKKWPQSHIQCLEKRGKGKIAPGVGQTFLSAHTGADKK